MDSWIDESWGVQSHLVFRIYLGRYSRLTGAAAISLSLVVNRSGLKYRYFTQDLRMRSPGRPGGLTNLLSEHHEFKSPSGVEPKAAYSTFYLTLPYLPRE